MEAKRIYVGAECIFDGIKDFKQDVLDSMNRAYKHGDKLNEQKFLNSIDWDKEFERIAKANRRNNKDSLKAMRLYREIIVVEKTLCTSEGEALKNLLLENGYLDEPYTIPIKDSEYQILDSSKPENHFGDILSKGFTLTGNALVSKYTDELKSWTARGGRSLFLDPFGDETDYQIGDEESIIYTVKKLSMVPKLLGMDKK